MFCFSSDIQESPTGVLSDYILSGGAAEPTEHEAPEDIQPQPNPNVDTPPQDTFSVSNDTDGNNSEEGAIINSVRNSTVWK